MFNLFKKKDPLCGKKQEAGLGLIDKKTNKWFCSIDCQKEFHQQIEQQEKKTKNQKSCCH